MAGMAVWCPGGRTLPVLSHHPRFSRVLKQWQRGGYRTNEMGRQIRPATIAMTWKREGGIADFATP